MVKKCLRIITTILCFAFLSTLAFGLSACKEDNDKKEEKVVYEGNMLYNGFESIKDMYKVEQYLPWLYSTLSGKFEVVEKDNFIPDTEKTENHVEADLSPREGNGALRIKYGGSEFGHILARFKNSNLAGLPVDDIGGFSVQIYNSSASKKTVELSLMREQNVFLNLDDGKFTLEPYKWTECKVTLDPIVVDYFANQLIGFNVRFLDVSDDVYYLDDFKVQFGKVYSEEALANLEKVNKLRDEIEKLNGKKIDGSDLTALESLCESYSELPLAYRYTIENYSYLETAVKECLITLGEEESARFDTETVAFFNSPLGITQIEAFDGGSATYINDENKLPNEKGSVRFDFDGSKTWANATINLTKSGEYDELHVWIKNTTENRYAFYPSWKLAIATYNVDGEEIPKIQNGFLITENTGWIHLVYTDQIGYFQFNIATMNGGSPSGSTIGSLYIGKVYFAYHNKKIDQIIEALPEYSEGYSQANKTLVIEAREAFENISLTSQGKVKAENVDKLVSIEANIWKENMAGLPTSAEELTEYNADGYVKVCALIDSYSQLKKAHKQKLTAEKTLLDNLKAKYDELQIAFVNSVKATIEALDGTDENAIKQARELYETLTEENKALIDNLDKLIDFEIDVWISKLSSLPTINDVTKYDIILDRKLETAREYYESLPNNFKAVEKVVSAVQKIESLETKLDSYGETIAKPGDFVIDAPTWTYIKLDIPTRTDFDEVRIYIKNNGTTKLAFMPGWQQTSIAYNESGEQVEVEYKYYIPKNSGILGYSYSVGSTDTLFKGDGLCFICHSDSNSDTPGTLDVTIERIVLICHAPIVEAQISALDGSDKVAITEARSAYEKLCTESKEKVSNIDVLITLEANVWKQENMVDLPNSADDVTDYDAVLYGKVEIILEAYSTLSSEHKGKLTAEKTLLDQIIEKLNTFQTTLANSIKDRINALDGTDVNEIKAIRAEYNKLTETNKKLVDNISTLVDFEANTWKAIANSLKTRIDNAKGWDDDIDNAIYDCNLEYEALIEEVKTIVASEYAIFESVKTKMLTYGEAVLNFDRNISQITSTQGATVEYVTDSHAPNQQGSLKVTMTGDSSYVRVAKISKNFTEMHIWVNNTNSSQIAFGPEWASGFVAFKQDGTICKMDANANPFIPANSGWLKLVYPVGNIAEANKANLLGELVIWSGSSGCTLNIGKISYVYGDTLKTTAGFSVFPNNNSTVASIDTNEHAPQEVASLKLVITATDKIRLANIYATGKTKVIFYVKNDSENVVNISLFGSESGNVDMRYTNPKVYDASGNELSALASGGVALPANSGWVKLEYTVSENFALTGIVLNTSNSHNIYIGKVVVE